MAESSGSFIPKRSGTVNRQPVKRSNFFVFSILSYAMFVAAPIASGAVFIYEKYVEKQFAQSVINLDSAIKNFSEADMQRVTEFDQRLVIANAILNSHVSFGTLFAILESSTAATVEFSDISISRADTKTINVTAGMSADAFDALLFQRSVYDKDQNIVRAQFNGITFAGVAPATENSASSQSTAPDNKLLTLNAEFTILTDQILFNPTVVTSGRVIDSVDVSTQNPAVVDDTASSNATNL